MPRDDQFLSGLHPIQEPAKPILGVKCGDSLRFLSIVSHSISLAILSS